MKTNIVIAVVSMSLGCALGYVISSQNKIPPPPPVVRTAEKPSVLPDAGHAASLAKMQEKLSSLERMLVKPQEGNDDVSGEPSAEVVREGPPRFMNHGEMLEDMKKNNPERYAAITNGIQRFRESRRRRHANLMESLAAVDTDGMSENTKRTHRKLQEALAKRAEIEESLHREDLSFEERGEIFASMREVDREVRDLNEKERNNLLHETVRMFGIEGADASALVETIRDVENLTDSAAGGFRGGPRQGGRWR